MSATLSAPVHNTVPDLTNYRLVHKALRQAADRLAVAARQLDGADRAQVKAFAKYWRGYSGEILAHHTVEDDFFFPALAEKVAVGAAALEAIDGDHEHLDHLMEAVDSEVRHVVKGGGHHVLCRLLDELAAHMNEHLDIEDADLLPLFERHFSVEEYEALDEAAIKSLGVGRQAAFTVPFVVDAADPDGQVALLTGAPAPLRILYRLTRKSHARLAAKAIGPALNPSGEIVSQLIDLTVESAPAPAPARPISPLAVK